jgi:hypothetical protein
VVLFLGTTHVQQHTLAVLPIIIVIIKSVLSSSLFCHQVWSVIKSGLSSSPFCHQVCSVIKSALSSSLVCHQVRSVIKSVAVSPPPSPPFKLSLQFEVVLFHPVNIFVLSVYHAAAFLVSIAMYFQLLYQCSLSFYSNVRSVSIAMYAQLLYQWTLSLYINGRSVSIAMYSQLLYQCSLSFYSSVLPVSIAMYAQFL